MTDPQHVFAALGDPTRLALYRRLSTEGPATATTLAEALPVTRQAVVKHLTALSAAGLVDRSRQGREVRFAIRPEALTATVQWMADVGANWDDRLTKLKAEVERTTT